MIYETRIATFNPDENVVRDICISFIKDRWYFTLRIMRV